MIESVREARFVGLYDEHHRAVLAYFLRRLDRDAAYDAFVVVWRRLDNVPTGHETLPWLYGVARHVLSNHLRGGRRADRLVAKLSHLRVDESQDPGTMVVQRAEDRAIVAALARLRGTW